MTVEIILGSESDREAIQKCIEILEEFSIPLNVTVLSAHRSPKQLGEYVKQAEERRARLFIAAAGLSASLAGAIAAWTIRPVIGIPLSRGPLNGMDAWIATNQMPAGVPVATVSIGDPGVQNGAILAVQILSLSDEKLEAKLREVRK